MEQAFEPRLSLEICWKDVHMLEVYVEACNGSYFGSSRVYIGRGQLTELSDLLSGFPKNQDDRRHFQIGGENTSYLKLIFYCLDKTFHTAVQIDILDEYTADNERSNQASFCMSFELGAMDRFLKTLREIDKQESGKAVLQGILPKAYFCK